MVNPFVTGVIPSAAKYKLPFAMATLRTFSGKPLGVRLFMSALKIILYGCGAGSVALASNVNKSSPVKCDSK